MSAYFEFSQEAPDGSPHRFVFKLVDATRIADARSIIRDRNQKHVQGTIVPRSVPYNPAWQFHLDPDSIGFFELATEVCDANVTYVRDHLGEVGGDFLPGGHWCPWSSTLEREITHLIDPVTEALTGNVGL